MPEGLPYVIAAFAVTAATLALWFWLIAARFKRLRALERGAAQHADGKGGAT